MKNQPKTTILLIATRNAYKVGEIRTILGNKFHYRTLNDYPDAPVVIEDAATFAGNATKKAVELAQYLAADSRFAIHDAQLLVLADDSGLEVDALGGKPGVHSARFAALDSGKPGNSSDAENCVKLLRLLKDVQTEKRSARFCCTMALTPVEIGQSRNASPVCYANEFELQTKIFEGFCDGRISFAPRGQNGFGYDPLFMPVGFEQTFAELGDEVKNRLSHRAKALEKLKLYFETAKVNAE